MALIIVNLVTLITGVVIVMAVVELLLQGMPRMKRDLFYIAFLVACIGFTSKYYYGPDIKIYTMLYDEIGTLSEFFQGDYLHSYEVGFVFYCTLCKSLGLSYWWMTAIVSLIFFYALFVVLNKLEDKRILALALVLVMLPDLIYAQFRQCLAVSFFTFAVLKAEDWRASSFNRKKDMLSAIVLGIIAVTMHKSAVVMVAVVAFYYFIQPYTMRKNTWSVLLMLLLILCIIPTQDLIAALMGMLDLNPVLMNTIDLHLQFMKLHQTNLLVYGTALVILGQFARERERKDAILAAAAAGMIVVVVLYQYYFMVNRLRSYFVILIIYYIFKEMRFAAVQRMPYVTIVRQTCEVLLILFVSYKAYSFDENSREEGGDILMASTVFELVDNDAETLQERQLRKADRYWDTGFLKSDEQNLRSNHEKAKN